MTTDLNRATAALPLRAHRRLVGAFVADQRGATAIEYCLIASGISIAIVIVVSQLGDAVLGKFQTVRSALFPS